MFASKETRGFYTPEIHGENMPPDVVEITAELHAQLMAGQSQGRPIEWGTDGYPFLGAPPQATANSLCTKIDNAADAARRAVAGDPLRAVEYEKAAAEAQAFAAAGYPLDAVPRTVTAWAISGRTPQQAADSILAEAAAYNEALYQIREARLQAKELVRQAMAAGDTEHAQDIAAETIASIQAAVAGIGNNAS